MNNAVQGYMPVAVLVIAFAFISLYSYRCKPHPIVSIIVHLLFLTIILGEVGWMLLPLMVDRYGVDAVKAFAAILEPIALISTFFLDILLITVLLIVSKHRKSESRKIE